MTVDKQTGCDMEVASMMVSFYQKMLLELLGESSQS